MLKDTPLLTSLALNLHSNRLGYAGAKALAALQDAPRLKTLSLDLQWNLIGYSGAQALATLKDAASLRSLALNLQRNEVGDRGACALAALSDARALTALNLDLQRNQISNDGVQVRAPPRPPGGRGWQQHDHGEGPACPPPPQQQKWCRAQKQATERTKEKESLWLLEAPVRKRILQMHTPAHTSQSWSRQAQHGLGVCIWMHLVNGTGNSLPLGQPTPE